MSLLSQLLPDSESIGASVVHSSAVVLVDQARPAHQCVLVVAPAQACSAELLVLAADLFDAFVDIGRGGGLA